MHIPENYLSPATCTVMFIAMVPVWKISIDKVKLQMRKRPTMVPMIGIGAAFSFLIMMFNFPVPGGTSAHAIGGTLLACLIGPYAACLSVSLALLFQAFLFGDGGILALGANAFNMAFVLPFVGYGIYWLFASKKHDLIGTIFGSYLGLVLAALATSIELGLQPILSHTNTGLPNYFPYGLKITIPVIVGTHLLIGVIEAIITACIYSFIKRAAKETIYFYIESNKNDFRSIGKFYRIILVILGLLAVMTPLGLIANGTAWGEWSNQELKHLLRIQGIDKSLPNGIVHGFNYHALFSNYEVKTLPDNLAYILISLTVFVCTLILVKVLLNGKDK